MILVQSIAHLKTLAYNESEDFSDFFILLAGGLMKSSKRVFFHPDIDIFCIINEIDDSYQEVSTGELRDKTLFIEAIEKKSLFFY